MENILTADFNFILYVVIAVIGLIIKITQESKKKNGGKASGNILAELKNKIEAASNPQAPTIKRKPIDDFSDKEVFDTLEKFNNNIYDTVQELKKTSVEPEKEWIEDNIEINEKGRYNLYSIGKKKKKNPYRNLVKNKSSAKKAFVASQLFEPKFKA